jgi:hypothetical protein
MTVVGVFPYGADEPVGERVNSRRWIVRHRERLARAES